MNYDDIQATVKSLYPVNQVAKGFAYWVRTLTEKCFGIFEYTGLPDSLPADEIEIRLIQTGHAAIFKHPKFGLVTSYGGLSGFDMYYKPTKFVYAQPILQSGTLDIHRNAAIIYNSQIDTISQEGLFVLIRRYARMLADIESSINIVTVNTRATNLVSAKTQTTAKSIDNVLKKIRLGEFETIVENNILDNISTFPLMHTGQTTGLSDLLLTREAMLRAFLQEIGVKAAIQKKERLITDEVASDDQLLLINLKDMLKHRKSGVDEVNKLFGTEIGVEISLEYNPVIDNTESEVNDNDNI